MTTEELNEIRNRLAHPLPLVLDCVKLLEEVQRLQIEVKERRKVMADIVRKLGHGRCGLEHNELAPAVERLQKAVAEARSIIEHIGYNSAGDSQIIAKANTWMKENP